MRGWRRWPEWEGCRGGVCACGVRVHAAFATLRHYARNKLAAVDRARGGNVEVLQERIHFVVRELLSEARQHVPQLARADLTPPVLVKDLEPCGDERAAGEGHVPEAQGRVATRKARRER